MEKFQQSNYKKAFRDIKNGFSEIKVLENFFYLKHISFDDQVDIESIYNEYYEKAKLKGVPTHKDVLKQLIEEKQWTQSQENKIAQYQQMIENFVKQKKNTYLKSEIERLNKEIEDNSKILNDLKNTRASLFSRTAESYAEDKLNDYYIIKCLFKDKDLRIPVYKKEEYDDIDSESLFAIMKQYNEIYSEINDTTIQKIVLLDFFNLYMPFCENPIDFYNKPVCDLSYNQLKLLIYARYFKNVFQQNENMPPEIRSDPDKIIDYINANENVKKLREKNANAENRAESIVGATKEDLEYLNITKPGQKTLSLADEAKKKGGSLSMDDMLKIFGN
jgi:hypothetical protein